MSDTYRKILSRLKTVLRRYQIYGVAEAVFTALAVVGSIIVVLSLVESSLYLAPNIKTPLFFSIPITAALAFAVYLLLRIIISRPSLNDAARMVEDAFPELGDRLISAVQLGNLDDSELRGQSRDLVDALLVSVETRTRTIDTASAVSPDRVIKSLRFLYGVIAVFLALTILSPGRMAGGLYRLADHSQAYTSPADVMIYVLNKDKSIIRGESYSTPGILSGKTYDPLNVVYRWVDSDTWHVKPVEVDQATGKFSMAIEKPRTSFLYYLETGQSSSSRNKIEVIERPVVESIEITLIYPAYTGLDERTLSDNDGNIRALGGSGATIRVRANKTLQTMSLVWSDSTSADFTVNGGSGSISFTVEDTKDYHIALVDTLGIENGNPIRYRVTCLIDEFPAVSILNPPPDVTLPLSLSFPLIYMAQDDYGISTLALRYTLPFEDKEREIELYREDGEKSIESSYMWDLSEIGLLPEDEVTYYLVVYDNDTVNGPKKSVSGSGKLRVPSMNDFMSDLSEDQEKRIGKLQEMSERNALEKTPLDEVRKNIIDGKELDWSDRNALDEATNDMKQMQDGLKELSDEISEAADRLSEEDMAAIETLEKYRAISDLMESIADGAMKDALKQLMQASVQLDPHQVKDAIEKHKVTAADMKKKLDRLIALLKQVKAIQEFETSKRLLEEIAAKEADLTAKFNENPETEGIAREQEKLASEMKSLQESLDSLMDELRENFDAEPDSLEQLLKDVDVSESMDDAAKSMKEGKNKEAEDKLDESNQMLAELLDKMDSLGSAMMESNSEEMKRRLFAALVALLAVSESQERFIAYSEDGNSTARDGNALAKRELEIVDSFSKSVKTLEHFGEIAVEVAGVLDQMTALISMSMEHSVGAFAKGNISGGRTAARESLKDLNSAIHVLTSFLNSGEGEGKGMPGDLMQQLQQIANGQQSLQMSMDGGMSDQMMMQLAAEQQMLADMLSELGNKISQDKQLRDMLEKLSEEMDDTADLMRRNEQRELVERKQHDIYRRLLDARRSRREKKEEKEERKSFTAKRNESKGADELAADLGEKKREITERINQAMKDDFAPEYQRLIRRYYESMLKDYDLMDKAENAEAGQ